MVLGASALGATLASGVVPTSTVPIGSSDNFYPAALISDDAVYTLLPKPGTFAENVESELFVRSVSQVDDLTALGDAVRVGFASGYTMAEHDGTLAYLAADGHLVLRASDGMEQSPAWGSGEDFLNLGPADLSSQWVAVSLGWALSDGDTIGGAVYDRSTGTRYDLMALVDDAPFALSYGDAAVTDGRAVWSASGFGRPGSYTGIYTVALSDAGPVGPVTLLASTDAADLRLIGFIGSTIAWTEQTAAAQVTTRVVDAATLAPVANPVHALPYLPVAEQWAEYLSFSSGASLVTAVYAPYYYPDPTTASLTFDDPRVAADEVTYTLSDAAEPMAVGGRLAAYQDVDGNAWLTDVTGLPIVDVSIPTVSVVEPPSGSVLGGASVTVRGSGFAGATGVTFGGVAGTDLQVVSSTELVVTAPAGVGTVPVVVTTPAGSSGPSADASFTFVEVVTQSPVRGLADWSVAPDGVQCVSVAGSSGVPIEASGVVLNVTTVRPNGPGYVVVYPDTAGNGATVAPGGSTVNFEPGADVANSAFVALPANGDVCYFTRGASNAGVLLDVAGYTLDGSGIVLQASDRLLDTRAGYQTGEVTGPVNPRQIYTVQVSGEAGVPADAVAVLMNVTVTGATTIGNLRVFPGGEAVPGTSVVNFAPGRDKANATIVALSATGTVSFYSDSPASTSVSPVQVILDVVGYVEADSAYTGVSPTRVMDTRAGYQVGPISGALAAGQVYSLPVAGVGPVPAGATAVVLNVTAVGPTGNGNLRVYPDSDGDGHTPPPGSSSINYIPGRDIPNQVVVALPANGQVNFYSDMGAGTVHIAADVVGYITGGATD